MHTFHRLFREEIMGHGLDNRMHTDLFNLLNDFGKILQNQPPGDFRPFPVELRQVMTSTTANVYQQHISFLDISAVDEVCFNRVEIFVHPARPSLAVNGHVVSKLLDSNGILLCKFKKVLIST